MTNLPQRKNDSSLSRAQRALSSAILLIISYILIFTVQQYLTGALCILFDYDPVITYSEIKNLPFDFRYWSFARVTLIFSAGPLSCLFAGIFFISLFNSLHGHDRLYRFFFLWLGTCGISMFLSFAMTSPFGIEKYESGFYAGFSIVSTWWGLGTLLTGMASLAAVVLSIVAGSLLCPLFLKFSLSERQLYKQQGRMAVITQLASVPVIIAAPLLLLLPDSKNRPLHFFQIGNLMLLTAGMYFNSTSLPSALNIARKDFLNAIPIFWLLLLAGVYSGVWFFLR